MRVEQLPRVFLISQVFFIHEIKLHSKSPCKIAEMKLFPKEAAIAAKGEVCALQALYGWESCPPKPEETFEIL